MSRETKVLASSHYAYHYPVTGTYSARESELLQLALDHFYEVVGDRLSSGLISSGMNIHIEPKSGNHFKMPYRICLNPVRLTEWTIVHELGHALDASYGWKLSRQMRIKTGSGFPVKMIHKAFPKWKLFWYRVGSPPPPCGVNEKFNSIEDFAETVAAFIFPEVAKGKASTRGFNYEKWGYKHFHETPRGRFFQNLLDEAENKTPSVQN